MPLCRTPPLQQLLYNTRSNYIGTCYNEFISQPSKWLRWRLSVSMCMPIRQYGYHGSLRAVWPVLICNCQLAVRGDSRIDSVLSLLISILIVAFGDS